MAAGKCEADTGYVVVSLHCASGLLDWAAAGFTDTEFGCDDETGGEPWEREGYSAASTSLRL